MPENPKLAAYLDLVRHTEQQTSQIPAVDRLTGAFSHSVFQAMQTGLSHEELLAAVIIGSHLGRQRENEPPNFPFLIGQLDYWEAVYLEAEAYWARRYRSNDE